MNELNLLEEALNLATGEGVFKNINQVNQIGHCIGVLKSKLKETSNFDEIEKEMLKLREINDTLSQDLKRMYEDKNTREKKILHKEN